MKNDALFALRISSTEELKIYVHNSSGGRVITTVRGPASISVVKCVRGEGRILPLEDDKTKE
jgi:hypothetical protein